MMSLRLWRKSARAEPVRAVILRTPAEMLSSFMILNVADKACVVDVSAAAKLAAEGLR